VGFRLDEDLSIMPAFAAIFPGQGAQLVGMGQDVAARFAAARDTFAEADGVLGYGLAALCFEGPAERLNATNIQQPAIFTTSVALYRAGLEARRFDPADIQALGGLSLGEYTALHLAGAFSFADGLRLVQRRGQLMQQAAEASAGGMVSVMGLEEDQVLGLCERVQEAGRVRPANYNCPGQIVVSGDRAACERLVELGQEAGGRMTLLPVAGAFHSEHMQPAADGLRDVLAATEIRPPEKRVVANVDAEYHTGPDAIRESLYRQVVNPVRWQACVERLIADGCGEFWEIGPNRHLTGMLRRINRRMPAVNLSTVEAFTTKE
jgi:[acyl-carrier-protein] S-malonyltransferase